MKRCRGRFQIWIEGFHHPKPIEEMARSNLVEVVAKTSTKQAGVSFCGGGFQTRPHAVI